jgi:hypothetical protein
MLTRPQAAPLRFIATRLAIPELEIVAREPGVAEAIRLTVHYHDNRHPDQVATLVKRQSSNTPTMMVHYRGADDKPLVLTHSIELERFRTLGISLRKLGFDKLDDFENIPWYGADLWLLERAASAFHHDMIIPPDTATGIHAEIISLVREHLREAIRAINP